RARLSTCPLALRRCDRPPTPPCSRFLVSRPSPAHPPALHSFPTRRSSDLGRMKPKLLAVWSGQSPEEGPPRLTLSQVLYAPPNRSEEHTSELQSLAYLVCRLLLEKKKKRRSERRRACDDSALTPAPRPQRC